MLGPSCHRRFKRWNSLVLEAVVFFSVPCARKPERALIPDPFLPVLFLVVLDFVSVEAALVALAAVDLSQC